MNISKQQQRVLHVLALGGEILCLRHEGNKINQVLCYIRDRILLSDCTMEVFKQLKTKKLISSKGGKPYRITKLGALSVRSQMMQR